jgi:hypothetical protein
MFRVHCADVRQQRRVRQVPAMRHLPATRQVLMKARHAYPQHPALHTNRPEIAMAFNEGIP